MKRFRWLIAVVLVGAVGLVVWGNFYRSRSAAAGLAVRVAPVQRGDVVLQVNAPGTLAPLQDTVVRARVSAPVAELLVKEGDRVQAGQVLVRQDDRDLATAAAQAEQGLAQAESALAALERRQALAPVQTGQALAAAELSVRQAQAGLSQAQQAANDRLEKARLDLNSLRQRESGSVPPDQFSRDLRAAMLTVQSAENDLRSLDPGAAAPAAAVFTLQNARIALEKAQVDAKNAQVLPEEHAAAVAAVASARQALDAAKERLADAAVRAPFSGTVLAMNLKVGDLLSPGSAVLTLGSIDTILARIRVDEVDVGTVAAGQSVKVSAAAFPGASFTGKVRDVAPQATVGATGQTGVAATFEVRAEIANADSRLKPGMNVDSEITTREARGALAIGAESLVERDGKHYVFVVSGDKAAQRLVEIGVRSRTRVEITSGLKEGEQVVTGPYDALKKLKDGATVQTAAPAPGTTAKS